jgi:hypothetical protein
MPLSLMRQNKRKMLQFTHFEDEDVEILSSDHAPITKAWTGPTKVREKKVRSLRLRVVEARDSGLQPGRTHMEAIPADVAVYVMEFAHGPVQPGCQPPTVTRLLRGEEGGKSVLVTYVVNPDGKPTYEKNLTTPVVVKDLIAASDAKVFIVSFAFLREHWNHLLTCHPDIDLFLVDELHLGYKRPDSAQAQSFFFINRHVENFVGMTGSLIDGQLDDAYASIAVIEPRYYGSHAGFLEQHAGFTDNYGRVLVWHNEQKVTDILNRHSVQVTFDEVYGKEDVVFFHELVDVGPLCREQYDKFHEQAMLELEDGRFLDGTMPGPATIRARQILAHPETMGLAKGEVTGKDQRIQIFAAEKQKMLIFAALKPEQIRIAAMLNELGVRAAYMNSDVPFTKRQQIDLAFREGRLDAIVASGPTAGVGWDWEMADHVIYASVDYQDTSFIQAYRRASRGTRTKTLRVTSLEYEDTIDRRQYDILAAKSVLANKVDPSRPVLRFAA